MAPSNHTLDHPLHPSRFHLGFISEKQDLYLHYNSYPHPHHTRPGSSTRTLYIASSPLGAVLLSPPILELNLQTREAATARYSRGSHSAHSMCGRLEATRVDSGLSCVYASFHPYFLALRYRANPFQNRLHQLRRKSRGERPQPTACCPIAKRSPRGLARLLNRCASSAFPALVQQPLRPTHLARLT
jgi:hypothetical protein